MTEAITTRVLLDVSEDTTGEKTELHTQGGSGVSLQVVITGTATVALQSSNNEIDWIDLAVTSASAGYELKAPWKFIRAVGSSMTSATAKVIMGI